MLAARAVLIALIAPASACEMMGTTQGTSMGTRVAAAKCVSLDGGGWSLQASNGTEMASNVSVPTDAHGALLAAGVIDDPYFRFNDARYAWVASESWTFSRPLPTAELLRVTGDLETSAGQWALVCEGLQTMARVTLGGVELGRVDNQYRRWSWPLPTEMSPAPALGAPMLALEFKSVLPLGSAHDIGHCNGGQPQSLRQEYLSWGNDGVEDYAQMVPPLPQGPWLSTYLVWSSAASPTIVDVVTQVTPTGGMPSARLSDRSNAFTVNATVHLNASHATAGTLKISGNWSKEAVEGVSTRIAFTAAGTQAVSVVLEAMNVALWWPNTYGAQPRYSLTAEFTSDSGESNTTAPSVHTSRLIGFRTIAFVNQMYTEAGTDAGFTGTPRLFYKVNGVPIFVRGANVVTLDVLESRVTAARYRNLLESARDAHFQIVRVNGDANYMKDEFYDLCDELGIMIHFEMMFSDCDYSHAVKSSAGFLANVRAEITHQVRRLSHHPSIALWLSNNEIQAKTGGSEGCLEKGGRSCWEVLFLETIMDAIVAEDRSRPLWPHSASNGWAAGVNLLTSLRNESEPLVMRDSGVPDSSHETHNYYFRASTCDCTRDWSALDGHAEQIYPDAAHASEFGWIGAESFNVFRRFSTSSDWSMNSSLLLHSANRIVKQPLIISRLLYNFPSDADQIHATGEAPFRRATYLSQLLQALCLRQESEHYRRGRDFSPGVAARSNPGGGVQSWREHAAGTMGTMYWMLNSDYPSPSWGSVDEDGNWRLTHYAMREAYSPVLASAVVMYLPGSAAPPPPPPPPPSSTCQTHFDMNADGTTITTFAAATPADCCAACGTQTQCKAYSWLNGKCFLSNSSGYHHADPRPLVSGLCTNSSCTRVVCSACKADPGGSAAATTRSLVVHIANDHYAFDGSSSPVDASSLHLELIRFRDGQSVDLALTANQSVQSGTGGVVFTAPVDDLLNATGGFCTSSADCFALATFRDADAQADDRPILNMEGGLALLANFKDLSLPTANINVTIEDYRVTLTADAVALYVTVSSSVRGRFKRNAVLMRPGVALTFDFLPWNDEPSNATFAASLSVQGVNVGNVSMQDAFA